MTEQAKQLEMFGDAPTARASRGGFSRSVVFHDYESFIKKFSDNPKTTDDCYTPHDVYEAVVAYVDSIYPLKGKQILRPFFPGGDYENADYPDDGVVIDNPPFSMFTQICKFYSKRHIPFFLFGPGMTIFSVLKYCSVVIINHSITFSNGAKVRINFATNLIGDTMVTTAVSLNEAIGHCPSQNQKANLPKYRYPEELISVSDFQTIAIGDADFSLSRQEAVSVKNLDLHPNKKGLFGNHLLVSKAAAAKAAAAKAAAAKAAAAKAAAAKVIPIELSKREQELVKHLEP